MVSLLGRIALCLSLFFTALAQAQSSSGFGYTGYNLQLEGDDDSVLFETANTQLGTDVPAPDVFLNASVHVGTISLEVDNLTAKINIDAQVLNLLQFNAGVDLSIDQVRLLIEDVNAKVLLEARLENLVEMINTTLSSIDLNPIIATLGDEVGDILNTTAGALGGSDSDTLSERSLSFELEQNILYSTNNYRASKHTNRVLAQNGDLVDHYLDNSGESQGQKVVGNYQADMTFNGDEIEVDRDGELVTLREYVYTPYHGLIAICAIYFDAGGDVVGTQVLAESSAGGSSTISEDV